MKLHRELGIDQRSVWLLVRRFRVAPLEKGELFSAPVELAKIYLAGRRRNISNSGRKALAYFGRRTGRITTVVCTKDRVTKQIAAARVVEFIDKTTPKGS